MLNVNNQKVESYLEEQEKLFSEWKKKDLHKDSVFIEDGVVNPNKYFACNERIVFLLKEAYSKERDNKKEEIAEETLTDWLNKESENIATIWRRVSEWTRMILKQSEGIDVDLFKRTSDITSYGNEFLRSIAVVNVKKSNGKSVSDNLELAEYADEDRKELFKQLQLCDPTIIVCGNVRECLSKIISDSKEKLIKIDDDNFIYRFNLNGHNVLVIDYWHPANRYPNLMNYYGFTNVCKVALSKR